MDIQAIVDLLLHLDSAHLSEFFNRFSVWAYILLFVVIFIETGLVVTPFLPGDSLLFVTGAIAAGGMVNIASVLLLLYIAAIFGDTVNYQIGHLLREKVQKREKIPLIKTENIDKAQEFLRRHGGKTITIARFIPIIRTFAPFVAGAGRMPYHKFLIYNIIGGFAWVSLMFGIGYFFGNISFVKDHFSMVIVGIVFISVLPAAVAYVHNKLKKRKAAEEETAEATDINE